MTDAEEAEIRRLARSVLTQPGRPIWERARSYRNRVQALQSVRCVDRRWTAAQAKEFGQQGRRPKRVTCVDDSVHVGDVIRMRGGFRRILAIRFGPYGLASSFLLSAYTADRGPVWTHRFDVIKRIRPAYSEPQAAE